MKIIITTARINIPLAFFEAVSLFGLKKKQYSTFDNLMIAEVDKKKIDDAKRLAYTTAVFEFLFDAKDDEKIVKAKVKGFDWSQHYSVNFCARSLAPKYKEAKYGGEIFDSLSKMLGKEPVVKLRDPKTQFSIFKFGKKIVFGKLLVKNHDDYEMRKPHLRPGFSPISIDPRVAKCCVNMTGAKKGDIILDPFCGTGGFMIEASRMGIRSIGSDNDGSVLGKAKKNMDFLGVKDYKLEKKDAIKINKRYDYIVSDLPYGKNTKSQDIDKLYLAFLKTMKKILKKRAVLVFPHYSPYKKLISKAGLKMVKDFSWYIHRSLTRKIVVIER
jgi:tRNA (guanine10-N2)-dimethyltransferase